MFQSICGIIFHFLFYLWSKLLFITLCYDTFDMELQGKSNCSIFDMISFLDNFTCHLQSCSEIYHSLSQFIEMIWHYWVHKTCLRHFVQLVHTQLPAFYFFSGNLMIDGKNYFQYRHFWTIPSYLSLCYLLLFSLRIIRPHNVFYWFLFLRMLIIYFKLKMIDQRADELSVDYFL